MIILKNKVKNHEKDEISKPEYLEAVRINERLLLKHENFINNSILLNKNDYGEYGKLIQILSDLDDYKDSNTLLKNAISNLKEDMENLSVSQVKVVMKILGDDVKEIIENVDELAEDSPNNLKNQANETFKNLLKRGDNLIKNSKPYLEQAKKSINEKFTKLTSSSQEQDGDIEEEIEIPDIDAIKIEKENLYKEAVILQKRLQTLINKTV